MKHATHKSALTLAVLAAITIDTTPVLADVSALEAQRKPARCSYVHFGILANGTPQRTN
jgi:hypothetical protein